MSQPENPSAASPREEDPVVLPPDTPVPPSSGGALQEIRPEADRPAAPAGQLPFIECYRCSTRVYLWGALDSTTNDIVEICPGCGEHLHISRVSSSLATRPETSGKKRLKKADPPPPLRERRPELKGAKEQVFFTQDKLQGLFPEETEETLQKRRFRRRVMTAGVFGMCFLTGGYLGWRAGITPPAPPPLLTGPLRPAAPLTPPAVMSSASPEDEKAARDTLDAFLKAESVANRLPWVLDAERLAPVMERYYQTAAEDSRYLEGVTWKPSPQSEDDLRRGILIFMQNTGPDLPPPRPPFVLFFRRDFGEKQRRFRLDWETYVQERERLAEKFLTNTQSPPGVFRVKIERKHAFSQEETAPGAAAPLGFSVRPAIGDSGAEGVLPPGHPLYQRFEEELKWTRPSTATVRLRWAEVPGQEEPRLEITDFYCWEFAGVGRPPEKPLESITLPETPSPVPPALESPPARVEAPGEPAEDEVSAVKD